MSINDFYQNGYNWSYRLHDIIFTLQFPDEYKLTSNKVIYIPKSSMSEEEREAWEIGYEDGKESRIMDIGKII